MPVTPFHLGPALAFKALLRGRFSLGVFTLSQAIIDTESAVNLLRDAWPVHAYLHTVPGSLAVAAVSAVAGKPVVTYLKGRLAAREDAAGLPTPVRAELRPVSWTAAIVGALLGGLSHVALDGIMHADMQPFAPWLDYNPWLWPDGLAALHLGCVILGAVGILLWGVQMRRGSTASSS